MRRSGTGYSKTFIVDVVGREEELEVVHEGEGRAFGGEGNDRRDRRTLVK